MENALIEPRVIAKRRETNLKFVFAGLIIVGAIAFLGFSSFQANSMYYLTVPELRTLAQQEGAAFYDKMVRVSGPLHKESIDWNAKTMTLKFHIDEGGDMFPIVYVGPIPDTMQNGESVVVEGKYTPAGEFNASTILVKCPSKYEPAMSESS